MFILKTLTVVGSILSATGAWAHPTAAQGSVAVMSFNMNSMSENTVYYSVRPDLSLGAVSLRVEDDQFYVPHVGILLKRWNETESQANVYAWGGYGVADFKNPETPGHRDGIWRVGAQADYETRRFYTMVSYMRLDNGKDYQRDMYMARVGWAPFLADFDQLSIWPILQVFRWEQLDSAWTVTPMLRFYFKNVLWELGAGADGDWIFNFMVHY